MKEQYYAFYLDDPAIAPYCSFDRLYVGTLAEIEAALEKVKEKECYKDTIEAFSAYKQGNTDGTHFVAQRQVPILTPVVLKASHEMTLGAKQWEHLNAWKCPYIMKFDRADVKQIVVKHEGEYHRLIKAKFVNLSYENAVDEWEILKNCYWGHGFLLDTETDADGNVIISYMLYEPESSTKLMRDALAQLKDENALDFETSCDEVFGNG